MSTHVMTGTTATSNATGERVRAVLNGESEVAHVWAANVQTHGRFRAIYFSGRTLYSYGSHYVIGRLMDDGVVLLNDDSNSMTTNGHRRAASYATQHKTRYFVPDLTEALRQIDRIDSTRRMVRSYKRDGADADGEAITRASAYLKRERADFREWMTREALNYHDDSAAGYVLRLAGLPARSWPAIKAEAERRAVRAKAETAKRKRAAALADMRTLARMTDSEFRESWPSDGGRFNGGDYGVEAFESFRKRLSAAHRLASAEKLAGFKRLLWQRLEAFREYAAGRPARIRAARLAELREEFATWRNGGAKPVVPYGTAERYPELAGDFAELRAVTEAERKAAALEAFRAWQAGEAKRPSAQSFAEGSAERAAIDSAIAAELESAVLALEAWRTGEGDKPDSTPFYQWRERQPAELVERVGGDPWRELVLGYSKAEAAERVAAEIEAERLRKASEAEKAAAWIAGNSAVSGYRLSDPDGGALLRIAGNPAEPESAELETSHGARVPLTHAIKAFRFVKLIRERGGHWERNGKQVRVGHYQLDRVDPDGFNAGCHRINWPEVERVAKLAGVFDCPADDSAVTETTHA